MYEVTHTKSKQNIRLSKFLSWLLRHGAVKDQIPIGSDGFVSVKHILNHPTLRGNFTENDIIKVVENDEKTRFAVRPNKESFDVRANQGHSIDLVKELELIPITRPDSFKCVVHSTFLTNWDKIKVEGLHRMKRNHIHFAQSLLDTNTVTSGLRKNAEIFIYINLKCALEKGLKFFFLLMELFLVQVTTMDM
ncbi:hypothetical protein HHI36_010690 [Cryptolaemus montrouzieri]|uniref:2'-phosphotransferase n=1 Tax=Cryptolaemus montrouzieri TaxID=559131 RepID=A0ABD2MJE9_9CUCU